MHRDNLRSAYRSPAIGLIVFAIGWFGQRISPGGLSTIISHVGVLLLLIWIIQDFPRILARGQIIERWVTLIPDARGKESIILDDTQQLIARTEAPDVAMRRESVAPGFVQAVLGIRRHFLVISNTTNRRLKRFRMYINASDYGTGLQVSWYVVQQASLGRRIQVILQMAPILRPFLAFTGFLGRHAMARDVGALGLDAFDEQDLRAYITNAHRCLVASAEKLMHERGRDTSRINTPSRGFLGIS